MLAYDDELPGDDGDYDPPIRGGGATNKDFYVIPRWPEHNEPRFAAHYSQVWQAVPTRPSYQRDPLGILGNIAYLNGKTRFQLLRLEVFIGISWPQHTWSNTHTVGTGTATFENWHHTKVFAALWGDKRPKWNGTYADSSGKEFWDWQNVSATWATQRSHQDVTYPTVFYQNPENYDVLAYDSVGSDKKREVTTGSWYETVAGPPQVIKYDQCLAADWKEIQFVINGDGLPVLESNDTTGYPTNYCFNLDIFARDTPGAYTTAPTYTYSWKAWTLPME